MGEGRRMCYVCMRGRGKCFTKLNSYCVNVSKLMYDSSTLNFISTEFNYKRHHQFYNSSNLIFIYSTLCVADG